MELNKEIKSHNDFLLELRRAAHNLNRQFSDILCEEGDEPESTIERAWVTFLWELDCQIRINAKS